MQLVNITANISVYSTPNQEFWHITFCPTDYGVQMLRLTVTQLLNKLRSQDNLFRQQQFLC